MGRELDPDNAMFSAVVEEEAPAPVVQEEPEGDDLGLDDLELSELARDLEEEGDELGRGAIPPAADDILGGGLNEAVDDLGDRISASTDSISEDDLSSLEIDLPPTEARRGSEREQEVISLDELEFGDSVSAEAQDLLKGLEAGGDEDLGADSVMKVDTDLEPSELEAELEKLTELSTLADEGADATAMSQSASESEFDLQSVFERDDGQNDLSALDFYDGEAEAEVGEDEVQTKLDLARAYVEMGDMEGARSILEEVQEEGSANQKDEAGRLLAQLAS
jgi:pilus assembly protein FimV